MARRSPKVRFTDQEIILFLRAYRDNPTSWREIIHDVKANMEALPEPARQMYNSSTAKQIRERLSTKLSKLLSLDRNNIENIEIRGLIRNIREIERGLVAPAVPQRQDPVPPAVPQRQDPVPPAVPQRQDPVPPAVPQRQDPVPPAVPQRQDPVPPAVPQRQDPVPPAVPQRQDPVPPAVPQRQDPVPPAVPQRQDAVPPAVPRRRPANADQPAGPLVPGPAAGPADVRDRIAAGISSGDEGGDNVPQRRQRRRKRKVPLSDLIRENQLLVLYRDWMRKKVPKILRELGISSSSSSSSDDDNDDDQMA